MDYEFRQDPSTGKVISRFSMEQALLGNWFDDELHDSPKLQLALRQFLSDGSLTELKQWQAIGREISIVIDGGEVSLWLNVKDHESDAELELGMQMEDAQASASLGVEDFEQALSAWLDFKRGY
ncbi:YacL family protein [Paraferrimonas sedimenticola]|uniref:Uncharacterized protein n=1 Tax=Paraferrimonas sedimenticola TaxID=375674 RepID=A0AA37W0Q4_9GAMM|nr:YacL family protein [Paraferrimonas sedimenticola]GLP95773.1 hypothetical protein GCM10007895_10790 [Paraferrimonas sedimenticola]